MNEPVRIPFSSPLYPLPEDYDSLTAEGQRLARVNACRQWIVPLPHVDDRARALIGSTWFFDRYYLHPDPDDDFDPGFYDMKPLPTPQIHWDLSRQWASGRLNVAIAPRGSAKSTHFNKDNILRLVSHPAYSIVQATSTHDNAQHTGQLIRGQCHHNPRINDDFGPEPEFRGSGLKPRRGDRPSGVQYFYLNNGSWFRCLSAESRIRSVRPRRFRFDDPEYDNKKTTSHSVVREYMDRLLFKVAIPTTMRANCGLDWVGTFVSRRHFLWHAMSVISTNEGHRALDSRFDHWNRLFIPAATEDPLTGALTSVWPEMWPVDDDHKLPGFESSTSLARWREIMGVAAFNNEMLGRPGDSDDAFFHLNQDLKGQHAYWYENHDTLLDTDPRSSSTLICWTTSSGDTVKTKLSDFLASSFLFCTVDTAYTEHITSDRRVVHLLALTRDNILISLDLWSDRKPDSVLVDTSFRLCSLWRCPLIYVEVVRESFALYHRYRQVVVSRLSENMGLSFSPTIRDIRPGMMDKSAKIATLDTRFEHGLIKLPLWRRSSHDAYRRLFEQIDTFSPSADNGGLEKDDEIDTLSMVLQVLKSKGRPTISEESSALDPISELRRGNTHIPGTNIAYATGLPLSALDPETLNVLLTAPSKESTHASRI